MKPMTIDPEHLGFVRAKHFKEGRIKPVQLIVIHSMEAPEKGETAENVAHYFQTTNTVASAHYCIDNTSAVQCVWDKDTAHHCKNANANGIGLEHAGFAKQTEAEWLDVYGRAMLEISAQISAYLSKKFNVPIQRAVFKSKTSPVVIVPGFCGHNDVPLHGTHTDPGLSFPWAWYLNKIEEYLI